MKLGISWCKATWPTWSCRICKEKTSAVYSAEKIEMSTVNLHGFVHLCPESPASTIPDFRNITMPRDTLHDYYHSVIRRFFAGAV
jgi:hypothetical protein